MKLALAQINPTVGDLTGNVEKILDAARKAENADLIVFPEMAVSGYPPRDILYDTSFVEAVQAANADLAQRARGLPPMLVGSFQPSGEKLYQHPALHNVAYLMYGGEAMVAAIKRLLPVYDVFLEPRWFVPGKESLPPIEVAGTRVGVIVCEDMWDEEYPVHPGTELKAMGAEMLVCLSASPYRRGAGDGRLYHARRQGLPIAFVNLVGGNDELIFDGGSFWLDGEDVEAGRFEEEILFLNTKDTKGTKEKDKRDNGTAGELFDALVLGVRDFARKNGMKRAVIGLSGGIDSSVAAVIVTKALGPDHVTGVAIPSRFTDVRSTESARELAGRLGMGFEVIGLEKLHAMAESVLGAERSAGVGGENVQARLRMIVLMSVVNQRGGFLVNTSNKTELALGYGTLYGDLAGALSPLGDVTKPEVYELARWINSEFGMMKYEGQIIPPFVMERKPSAELREDQVDPFDYETLAPAMETLVLANQSDGAMRASEHKRRQAGVILKVSEKAFGSGRLMPLARR